MNLYFLRYFETINFFLNNLYYYYGKYFIVFDLALFILYLYLINRCNIFLFLWGLGIGDW